MALTIENTYLFILEARGIIVKYSKGRQVRNNHVTDDIKHALVAGENMMNKDRSNPYSSERSFSLVDHV